MEESAKINEEEAVGTIYFKYDASHRSAPAKPEPLRSDSELCDILTKRKIYRDTASVV